MKENEYLIVKADDGSTTFYCNEGGKLRKFTGGSIKTCKEPSAAEAGQDDAERCGGKKQRSAKKSSKGKSVAITPRNEEQTCAFDLMKDRTKTVKLITGTWGTGKAQPITTVIPTPAGERQLKDLHIGDYVFDRHGHPTKILGIFPQGKLDVYKLTLADGRSTLCGPDHLWAVKSRSGQTKTVRAITAKEMFEQGVGDCKFSSKCKKEYINYKWHLPMNGAADYFNKAQLPVDPYIVGCFLGDGCCTETDLTISSGDEFIPQEVARLLGSECSFRKNPKNLSWGFRLPIGEQTAKKKNFQTRDVFYQIPELMTDCLHKRIPECYFASGIEDRFNLLQGLLDTGGSVSKAKARVALSGQNIGLCEDVIRLIRSLGMRCRLSYGVCKATGKKEYSVHIAATPAQKMKLFRLPRKLSRVSENNDRLEKAHTLNKT